VNKIRYIETSESDYTVIQRPYVRGKEPATFNLCYFVFLTAAKRCRKNYDTKIQHTYFNCLYSWPIKLSGTDGFQKLEKVRLLHVCKFVLSPLQVCSSGGKVDIIIKL